MTEPPSGPHGYLSLAAETSRWKLVCSALPIEQAPTRDAAYGRWADTHGHGHSQKEILFCFEGETFQRFDGRDYRCGSGTVFLIDSNEEHAVGYPPDGRSFAHLWLIGLGTGVVANLYSQRRGKALEHARLPMAAAQAECDLLSRCWNDARHPASWMSHAILRTALASALFAVVFRALRTWESSPDGDAVSERRREVIAAVQRHIEAHLDQADSLDALAHLAGYSKFHFTRVFRECTGRTVHGFVDACRVTKVRELTRQGLPCKAIAAAVGFSCPAAFSNWLRTHRVQVGV